MSETRRPSHAVVGVTTRRVQGDDDGLKANKPYTFEMETCPAKCKNMLLRSTHFLVEYSSLGVAMLGLMSLPKDIMKLLEDRAMERSAAASGGASGTVNCTRSMSNDGGELTEFQRQLWNPQSFKDWQPLAVWYVNLVICLVGAGFIFYAFLMNNRAFGTFRYYQLIVAARRGFWFQTYLYVFGGVTFAYFLALMFVVGTNNGKRDADDLDYDELQSILSVQFILVFSACVTGLSKCIDADTNHYDKDDGDHSDDIVLELPYTMVLAVSRRVMWKVEILTLSYLTTGNAAPLKRMMRYPTEANIARFCKTGNAMDRRLRRQANAEAEILAKASVSGCRRSCSCCECECDGGRRRSTIRRMGASMLVMDGFSLPDEEQRRGENNAADAVAAEMVRRSKHQDGDKVDSDNWGTGGSDRARSVTKATGGGGGGGGGNNNKNKSRHRARSVTRAGVPAL